METLGEIARALGHAASGLAVWRDCFAHGKPAQMGLPLRQDPWSGLARAASWRYTKQGHPFFISELGMPSEKSSHCFVQFKYYQGCSAAGRNRPLLARIALAVGNKMDYAVDVGSLFRELNWDECQLVLALMSFRSNTAICWRDDELRVLADWAEEENESPTPR
ncbi:hypothetical protein HH212_22825 [Massilia forsythiae]|uniref:Uncharacterized protein n=1 Tax=Massilia forsythiae TaxID=2728020 RepID=A0A7Z2ZVV0_9BURK|nr:hypothetical protein [Massilia forsythiae]QJE02502.1 hypothetical protein HH212_22825 [Massilia forsythiae]